MFRRLQIILTLLVCLYSGFSAALDRSQPIALEADQVEVDELAGTSTYMGNVRLTQGELLLEAQRVIVYLKNNRIDRMEASGNPAKLVDVLEDKSKIEAEANTMDYNVGKEEILLTGEGILNQNGNVLENDRIVYNLKTGTLNAGGENSQERVKVILQPSDETQ